MRKSAWKYYGVKLIFQRVVTGKPIPECVDDYYSDTHTFFEESVMLVRAQSFDHAFTIAERRALEYTVPYINVYGQTVEVTLIDAIDCFLIYPNDDGFTAGTELYSSITPVEAVISPGEYLMKKYEYSLEDYELNTKRKERNINLQQRLLKYF